MKTKQVLLLLFFLFTSILYAQTPDPNAWKLQPWIQVVGYKGQNLGSSVSFIGKIGDSTQISVSDINGINMYRIKSLTDTVPRFYFPGNKCILGDFNGDGIQDLVVGGNPTKIYLGKAPGVFDTIAFFTKYQEPNGYDFGEKIAVGKINGDKYDDLVVTDQFYPNGFGQGKVYVFFGGIKIDTVPNYTFLGDSILNGLGLGVATGDLNNDGFDDIVVKGYDQSGTGPNGTIAFSYIKIFQGGNQIDTVAWKYIKGGDNGGRGVASFDINGDGVKDLLWCNYSPKDSSQSIYIHFSNNGNIDTIPSTVLPNHLAYNLANAGDMNGDGYNDIVISGNGSDQGGNSYIFVYSGGPKMDTKFDAAVGLGGESDIGLLGSITNIGDINNDGYADILVGAKNYQWGSYQGWFGILLGSSNIPTGIKEEKKIMPTIFTLLQNYPNPFNPSTTISYQLSAYSHITLNVYDVLGKEIKLLIDKEQLAGKYTINFDGSKLASGVYFYTLTATDGFGKSQSETKSMLLIK